MKTVSILFPCDGAPTPRRPKGVGEEHEIPLSHVGPKANLNLRIENLSHALLTSISQRAADLVRTAAYVYAADQCASRGGLKDIYGEHWRRHMSLCVPVTDSQFWNRADVTEVLEEALDFLSGDSWHFSFVAGAPEGGQLILNTDKQELHGRPDSVAMLSGGADSLAAAVDAFIGQGLRPLLVSHRSTPPMDSRQTNLVTELRRRFGNWSFPHISCWVHRRGKDAPDTTQRVRPFLFASLGAAVAHAMEIDRVIFSDNGIVSLNIPINRQLLGSLATRSTHPKFIALFNRLLEKTFESPPQLTNTLADRTRAEALKLLREHGAADLFEHTVSCVHARARPFDQPHCGVCSQCVDRRFASLATGMERAYPPQKYGIDIFRDPLPEGEPRTLSTSYVRFARKVHKASPEEMFDLFPELGECVLADDLAASTTAARLIALLKRQAVSVLEVYAAQVASFQQEMTYGWLAPQSLIALCSLDTGVESAEEAGDVFAHDEGYFNVRFRGVSYALTTTQAQVVRLLHGAWLKNLPEVRQARIGNEIGLVGAQVRDIFRNSNAYRTLVVRGSRKGTFRLNI